MLIEKPICDIIFAAIVTFTPSVIVCEIFTVEMCIMTLTFRMGQGQMVRVAFSLSAKVYEMFTVE